MSNNLFSFNHAGGVYTFEKPFAAVLTPRFLRHNRRRSELDLTFTILEEIAGPEALDAIDAMDNDEFNAFGEAFRSAMSKAMGATLGE